MCGLIRPLMMLCSIQNDTVRTIANAVNYNAQILKDALNRIAELEKTSKPQAENEE